MKTPRLTFSTDRSFLPLQIFLGILILWSAVTTGAQPAGNKPATPSQIPAAQFSRTIQDFSEDEGNFASDNFVSNETSYLHVIEKLKQLGVSGGAYVGVGPEQNFTYIAKVRPEIAFIVDIRRQAIIQHLMYKAIFQISDDRAQFLSRLFSKPLKGKDSPGRDAAIADLVAYFTDAPTSREFFTENLVTIRKKIEKDFEFPLSPGDDRKLIYVLSAFRDGNLDITTRFAVGAGGWYGGSSRLRDLFLAKDLNGDLGNFLATEEDYEFVRDLQRKNRIIPVVGDFAGTKALTAVAGYLRKNGYTVSAFYTSNVEQYLFGDEVFNAFVENVKKLPINDRSVFIRSMRTGWAGHPGSLPGHRMTTLLQKINIFLQDFDQGLYPDYATLVTTHFIAGNDP